MFDDLQVGSSESLGIIVDGLKRGEPIRSTADRYGVEASDLKRARRHFREWNYLNKRGSRGSWYLNEERLEEDGMWTDVYNHVLNSLAMEASDRANNLVLRLASGDSDYTSIGEDMMTVRHYFRDRDFRDIWSEDDIPGDLTIPQWKEVLCIGYVLAEEDGTIGSAQKYLEYEPKAIGKHLSRIDSVKFYPEPDQPMHETVVGFDEDLLKEIEDRAEEKLVPFNVSQVADTDEKGVYTWEEVRDIQTMNEQHAGDAEEEEDSDGVHWGTEWTA